MVIDLSGTSTQIIAQRAPEDATTTTSTTVPFLWDFYNPGDTVENTFDASAIYLNDLSHPATTTLFAGQLIATSSGIQSQSQSFLLRAGDTYQWYPILHNSSTGATIVGKLFSFNVISGPELVPLSHIGSSTSPFAQFATSTCTILNPTGCLQNAITWAFWPPSGAFDGFAGLYQLVQKTAIRLL